MSSKTPIGSKPKPICWISSLLLAIIVLILVCSLVEEAVATEFKIYQKPLGSGDASMKSGMQGNFQMFEKYPYSEGVYFTPQYMPQYPTAAPIWPRIVDLNCLKVGQDVVCEGYNWTPDKGRGEYLMYRPRMKDGTPIKTRTIYVEVPIKQKAE